MNTSAINRVEVRAIQMLQGRTSSNFSHRLAETLHQTSTPEEFVRTLIEAIVYLDNENVQLVKEKIEYETNRETPRKIVVEGIVKVY